jgi:hypothetical protein
MVTPDACPAGSYCPKFVLISGIANVINCPAGTYSSDKYLYEAAQCNDCQPGKYCLEGSSTFTGYCNSGFVCVTGSGLASPSGTFDESTWAATSNGPCPTGHYCPYGSGYPRKCPVGTYAPTTGLSECLDCPAHNYCATAGLSAVTGTCSPGFYCILGSSFYKPYDYAMGRICAQGNYCYSGEEHACPGGYYAPVEGLSLCYDCPPGFYCNTVTSDGGTVTPLECTTGHFCPGRTEDPFVCANGTYTQSYQLGLESSDQCSSCPSGYYCDAGLFNRTQKCDAGYYCHSGAYERDQEGLECPTGFYCLSGTDVPTACPDGKYSPPGAMTEEECTECLAGYYCVRYS